MLIGTKKEGDDDDGGVGDGIVYIWRMEIVCERDRRS